MEPIFQELDIGRDGLYGMGYIGTINGSFRGYPTYRQLENNKCADYDPRYRPWYVTAASGGKNVILFIDTSKSMEGDKLTLAKEAAKSVLTTFSNNDFIGVVSFNSQAENLLYPQI